MKLKSMVLIALFFTSCVAPRDKRSLYAEAQQQATAESNSTGNGSSSSVDVVDDSTDSGNSITANVPTEIADCNWSSDGSTGFNTTSNDHLGPHTICQSNTNKNDIYLQLANPRTDVRVCVIPVYEEPSTKKAIFLGEARCAFINSDTKIFKFSLLKNRDYGKYQNFPVNSVMVMKEQSYFFQSPFYRDQISYDAFFICSVYMDLHGDSSYCDAFKARGEYVYKRFPN